LHLRLIIKQLSCTTACTASCTPLHRPCTCNARFLKKYARLFEKYARLFEKYARLFEKNWHFR